jgi:hypothetical protein
MANPTGHTYHYGEHHPLQEEGGPGVVYRQGELKIEGSQMSSPRRLDEPSWSRLTKGLQDAGHLSQRYPWSFFVLGMVAGGLFGQGFQGVSCFLK